MSLFTLSRPSGGAVGVVSVRGRRGGRPKVRGRPIAHTWSPKSALRRETLTTMGDRRMVFGDGLEDIKVDGKNVWHKRYLLKPGLFSWVSVIQRWRWAGWIFHPTCHHRINSTPLAFWADNRTDSGLLQVRNSTHTFLLLWFAFPYFFWYLVLSPRYADLSIVALSSRLDGVEQHHADKWDWSVVNPKFQIFCPHNLFDLQAHCGQFKFQTFYPDKIFDFQAHCFATPNLKSKKIFDLQAHFCPAEDWSSSCFPPRHSSGPRRDFGPSERATGADYIWHHS